MASSGNKWQHRKADSIEERFGLLDASTKQIYKKQPIFEEPEGSLPDRQLIAMGVTCGIGSMLVGAAQDLGYAVVGNVEWRDYYRYRVGGRPSTLVDNFPGAFMARGLNDVPVQFLPGDIDLIAGHPECGRYSNLSHTVSHGDGQYKATRAEDVSDIPLFLKIVAELRPRFFLLDDLPQSFVPFPIERYAEMLPDYDLYPEWVSNWGYGNIQMRRNRMFMIGSLKSEKFAFRAGEKAHSLVLKNIISDLIEIDRKRDPVPNHNPIDLDHTPGRYVNWRHYGDRATWREISQTNYDWRGQIPYHSPEGVEKVRPGTWSPRWDEYCPVLSGGFNPLHPIRRLPLTVRERARIQGFPDDFVFNFDEEGPNRAIWEPYSADGQRGIKQTGKAMPLQFCTFFADQVKHHIEGRKFKCTGKRIIKPNDKVSEAKLDYCLSFGYEDQDAACAACWLQESCPVYKASNNA